MWLIIRLPVSADVQCGKLIFEILEMHLAKSKLLGGVEIEGCDIQMERDSAYSLYVRDPNYVRNGLRNSGYRLLEGFLNTSIFY